MVRFRWTKAQVAGVVGGVVLAGGIAVAGGIASAQSPTPSPSPSPSSPAASPNPNRSGQPRVGRPGRADLAARLAQALNIPQSRVEDALRALRDRARAQVEARRTEHLTQAAATLGVTEQQLRDAIAATRNQARTNSPGQGPRMGRPDMSAYFGAIAQQLGRGITADQVRDALRSARPGQQTRPDRTQIEARRDQFVQELAGQLGVSADQLRAALQSLGGRMPGGMRGR